MQGSTGKTGRTTARAGRLTRAALVSAVLALGACSPLQSLHGYVPEEETLAQIEVGLDTRETVAAFLGRPSTDGLLNDEAWYYVQSRWRTIGPKAPEEIERQVVAVSFGADGRVENIERFGLERGEIVPLSRRVTTVPIKGRSALAQIFSNFGRVDAGSLLGNR